MLQNLALLLWTGNERSVSPDYAARSIELGAGLIVPVASLAAFGVAGVLVTGLFLWLRWTELGRASRALAENPVAAVLMGIDVNRMYAIAFGISAGLGVASGVVLSMIVPITPFMGLPLLVKGFCIIVLGGLGSLAGTVLGAFVLATVETLVSYFVPDGGGWSTVARSRSCSWCSSLSRRVCWAGSRTHDAAGACQSFGCYRGLALARPAAVRLGDVQ